ncbi:MAG: hypothetical protein V4631_22215 [Pseudomonadota bacterium]
MSAAKNGGPAFPALDSQTVHRIGAAAIEGITDVEERDRVYIAVTAQAGMGMSLRDYFAANAPISTMDAMVACGVDALSFGCLPREHRVVVMAALAEMRGDYADAMLTERAK